MKCSRTSLPRFFIFAVLILLPTYFVRAQPADPVLEPLRARLEQKQKLSDDDWARYLERVHKGISAIYREDVESLEIADYSKRYLLPYREKFLVQNHHLVPFLVHKSVAALYEDKQYEATADLIRQLDQITPIEHLTDLTPTQRYDIIVALYNAYRQLGKYGLGMNLTKRSISFLKKESSIEKRMSHLNFSLGVVAEWEYKENKNWETVVDLCEQMRRNCRESTDKAYCYINAYNLEGELLTRKGDYQRAKRRFNKCFDIIARNPEVTDAKKAKVYSEAAKAYYYSNELPTAITYFKKATEYGNEKFQSYVNIGACYTHLEEFDKAEEYINKALASYGYKFGAKHPYAHLRRLQYNHAVVPYLQAKNYQVAFQQGEGVHYLYKAQPYFEQAARVIEKIGQEVEDTGTGRYFIRYFYNIIEQSINNRYHLYRHTDSLHHLVAAFDYAERSKALLLKEAVQRSQLNYPLPEALAGRRQRLEKRIAYFENRVYEQEEQDLDVSVQRDSVVWAKQAYHNFMDSVERAFPDYKRLRVKHRPLDIRAMQQQLAQSKQGLIQYFAGYEHLYMFRVWQGHFDLLRVPKPRHLEQRITQLRNSLYEWAMDPTDKDLERYQASAHQLYAQIFRPLEEGLPQRLVIVADGVLQNIPFDVLLRDSVDLGTPFEAYPYLIKDYQVSYAHSSYLQFAELPRRRAPKSRILGFAPSFEETGGPAVSMISRQQQMGPLLSNTVELEAISNRFPLDPTVGAAATRQRFLELAPQYSVLHLATHAKANNQEGESSYLCFSGNADSLRRLYTRDLYSIDLNADLVVLSACETGIGQLAKGEGNISLARGFAQAGARSLVNTLWRVSDQAAAELMTYFYDGLEEGQTKDEALRNAKLQYLATAPAAQRHPFFWGAYVGTGDMSPLQLSSNRRWWWIGGLLLVGGLFVFYRWRR